MAFVKQTIRPVLVLLILAALGCSSAQAQNSVPPARPYLLHLPGISGKLTIDEYLVQGLRQGGWAGDVETYDWTCGDPGIHALLAYARNQDQAAKIAAHLTQLYRANPKRPIYITAHSGGNGLAVWAMEKLPTDVKIQSVLLLAPALSPQYDLSKAFAHVSGKVYVFSSPHDNIVLGSGTKVFGTIDGVHCDAAGCVGFTEPEKADAMQYRKLVWMPYQETWMRYGNYGDHIGPMMPRFAESILAPLLLHGTLPAQALTPSTQPVPARS